MNKKTSPAPIWQIKWEVWRSAIFNSMISPEYHEALVRLQGCSEGFLRSYIKNYPLSPEAEKLMVELYAANRPELLAIYMCTHSVSSEAQIAVIKSKNLPLLQRLSVESSTRFAPFRFCLSAQLALVELNDAVYFRSVYNLFPALGTSVVQRLIELQNIAMFDAYLFANKTTIHSFRELQELLLTQNNPEMIDCYLQYEWRFFDDILYSLIKQENYELLGKLMEKRRFSEKVEVFLAQNGSEKMLEQYIQLWEMCPSAQIELINRNSRELLKLHFLKHRLSERALTYQLALAHFQNYIGVDSSV